MYSVSYDSWASAWKDTFFSFFKVPLKRRLLIFNSACMLTILRFFDLFILTHTSYLIYLIFFKFYKTVAFTFYINKQSLFTKVSLFGLFYSEAHNVIQRYSCLLNFFDFCHIALPDFIVIVWILWYRPACCSA